MGLTQNLGLLSTAMKATSTLNVGIGTSSPGYKLSVQGSSLANMISWTDAINNTGYLGIRSSAASIGADNNLVFETAATERMRITSGGNVLIGKTSVVGFPLEVNGGVYASSFRINDTGGGYVTLAMQDSGRWSINYLGRFSGYGAGTLTTDANGFITASSDRTLKNIIKPVENVLDKIMEFEPVYFKWNDKSNLDKESIYISTIAQSIEKNFPEAVGKMADGTLTVQDRAVMAILVKAIQELKAEIDILKNK